MDGAREINYTLNEGAQQILLNLYGAYILKITREGKGYNKVYNNTINQNEVLHQPIAGKLKFHVPGNPGGESVNILIRE